MYTLIYRCRAANRNSLLLTHDWLKRSVDISKSWIQSQKKEGRGDLECKKKKVYYGIFARWRQSKLQIYSSFNSTKGFVRSYKSKNFIIFLELTKGETRWTYKKRAKIIWSQGLCSSEQADKELYWVSAQPVTSTAQLSITIFHPTLMAIKNQLKPMKD